MTTLNIDQLDAASSSSPLKVNWSAVAVAISVISFLIMGASGAFGDYRRLGERVTILETQRTNDSYRLQRIEDKVDRLLERRP